MKAYSAAAERFMLDSTLHQCFGGSVASDSSHLYGVPREAWLSSGALTPAQYDDLTDDRPRIGSVSVTLQGWLQLVRARPEYATLAWERWGPGRERRLEHMETSSPSFVSADRYARMIASRRRTIAELRHLAGLDP